MHISPDLKPGENFPSSLSAPQESDLLAVLKTYGITGAEQIRLIDSTHDPEDIRLNYIIDNQYVLRFCNVSNMTEKRMEDLFRLIERYRALHFLCPQFIKGKDEKFLHPWQSLQTYLSEYIDLPIAGEKKREYAEQERLLTEVTESVARFAQTYRNTDLSETMGMYSLFDLSPFDIPNGIDEKEDNFNELLALLRRENQPALVDALAQRHTEIREKLKTIYRSLPRCVFQGDENFSNVLLDQNGHFAGFIDFNLAGTEVIVNQFVNLAGFDYDEEKSEPEGAEKRLQIALNGFSRHMERMFRIYRASRQEVQAAALYAWIVMIAQWPAFCFFRRSLQGRLREETLELLSLIAALPTEALCVRPENLPDKK